MKNRINISEITGEGLSLNTFLLSQMTVEFTVFPINNPYIKNEERCPIAS